MKQVKGICFQVQETKNLVLFIAITVLLFIASWLFGGIVLSRGSNITENQAKTLVESYYAALMERDYSKIKSVTTSRFQLEQGMVDEHFDEALEGMSVSLGRVKVSLNTIRNLYDTIEGKKMVINPVKGSIRIKDNKYAVMTFYVVEGANLRQEAIVMINSLLSSEEMDDQSRKYYLDIEFRKVKNQWLIDRIRQIDEE